MHKVRLQEKQAAYLMVKQLSGDEDESSLPIPGSCKWQMDSMHQHIEYQHMLFVRSQTIFDWHRMHNLTIQVLPMALLLQELSYSHHLIFLRKVHNYLLNTGRQHPDCCRLILVPGTLPPAQQRSPKSAEGCHTNCSRGFRHSVCRASCFTARMSTFPTLFWGSDRVKTTSLGTLYFSRRLPVYFRMSSAVT